MNKNLSFRLRWALELERLRRKNLQKMHPLRQLFWECTLRCNMSCLHCGSDCKVSSVLPDMPAEDFLKVIDEQITPHVNPHQLMVIFSGGEPLMREDIEEV
ncbi:MAG: radical SAM/SPASM domain-containing protein, partial [Paludibacteraceae bacterium]|nr:radical SAM/SPASM domain-containing protein [Paludibacteraceae bacterium]